MGGRRYSAHRGATLHLALASHQCDGKGFDNSHKNRKQVLRKIKDRKKQDRPAVQSVRDFFSGSVKG